MARMYPDRLPDTVESAAERTLYIQFKAQLSDSFAVLHSVKWLMRDRRRFDRDGEIDFLVLHPDLGVLVLEVKGGRVRLDGSTGRWYTKNRLDEEFELKESPFDQARRNVHDLLSKLEEAPKTRLYSYRTQRGIALPDITVGDTDFGLYGDREIVIDSTDMFRLEVAVRRIMGTPQQRPVLNDAAINALIDTVQPSLSIERIGLGTHVVETEERLASLTTTQYAALDLLQGYPRVAISGCAGSGKTMLAMEKARRLASEGFTVLFTCFNRNLAHWIDARFRDDPYTVNERIFVRNYHDL